MNFFNAIKILSIISCSSHSMITAQTWQIHLFHYSFQKIAHALIWKPYSYHKYYRLIILYADWIKSVSLCRVYVKIMTYFHLTTSDSLNVHSSILCHVCWSLHRNFCLTYFNVMMTNHEWNAMLVLCYGRFFNIVFYVQVVFFTIV